jgi:hypothetical protein
MLASKVNFENILIARLHDGDSSGEDGDFRGIRVMCRHYSINAVPMNWKHFPSISDHKEYKLN